MPAHNRFRLCLASLIVGGCAGQTGPRPPTAPQLRAQAPVREVRVDNARQSECAATTVRTLGFAHGGDVVIVARYGLSDVADGTHQVQFSVVGFRQPELDRNVTVPLAASNERFTFAVRPGTETLALSGGAGVEFRTLDGAQAPLGGLAPEEVRAIASLRVAALGFSPSGERLVAIAGAALGRAPSVRVLSTRAPAREFPLAMCSFASTPDPDLFEWLGWTDAQTAVVVRADLYGMQMPFRIDLGAPRPCLSRLPLTHANAAAFVQGGSVLEVDADGTVHSVGGGPAIARLGMPPNQTEWPERVVVIVAADASTGRLAVVVTETPGPEHIRSHGLPCFTRLLLFDGPGLPAN